MSTTPRIAAAVALAAALVSPLAARAEHGSTTTLRIQPQVSSHRHELPRFGMSTFNDGYGEQIVRIGYGGLAWRLGLERGDRILRINRSRLNYRGSWWDALQLAMDRGGHVRLFVQDVRTWRVVTRHVDFDPHAGPIVTPKVQVVDYHNDHPHEPHIVQPPVVDPHCGTPPYYGDQLGPATPKFRQPPAAQRRGPQRLDAPPQEQDQPTASRKLHRMGRLMNRFGL